MDNSIAASYVYAIQCAGSGYLKIGITVNPWARLGELQVGNPSPLSILALWRGGESEETTLHALFADRRIRGEWFNLDIDRLQSTCETLKIGRVEIPLAKKEAKKASRCLTPDDVFEQEQLDAFFALIEAEAVAEGDEAERLKAELDAILTEAEAAA